MAGRNILIVDDDNKAVRTMIGVLETKGYAVFASDSKGAALELSHKIRPSLVFVNAILSDASGLEVTRALRALDFMKDVPIIMLTEIDEEFSDRYKSTYGIVSFLKKPIDEKELLRKTALYVMLDSRVGELLPGDEADEFAISPGEKDEETGHADELDMPVAEPVDDVARDYGEIDLDSLMVNELREEVGEEEETVEEEPPLAARPEREHPIEAAYEKLKAGKETGTALGADDEVEPDDATEDERTETFATVGDEEMSSEATGSEEDRLASVTEEETPRSSALTINRNVMIGVPVAIVALLVIVWYLWSTSGSEKSPAPMQSPDTTVVQEQAKTEPLSQEPAATGSPEAPVVSLPQLPSAEESVHEATGTTQQEASTAIPSGKATAPEAKPSKSSEIKPGYYVQVGAFGVRDNAERMYESLKRKNYNVSIKRDIIQGHTMYRVLIGRYGSRASAVKAMKRITSEEKINATLHRVS